MNVRYFLLFILLFSLDGMAQKWFQRADFAAVGRHRGTALAIGNKGYVGIGHMNGTGVNIVYKDWWQYDPASNSWTQKADYPVPNYAAIAFATDTKGYIGGGTGLSTEFFEYNPLTNVWAPIANCPLDLSDQTAFAINNKGYAFSGNQCVEYNPATNSWAMKNAMPFSVSIWASSFVVGGSGFIKSFNQTYEYKPSIDSWIARAPFPGVATGGSSAFALDEKGYIVTGYAGSLAAVTKEVWEFNPGNNTWTQLEDFEGSARRFSCGITIQNRGYFGIGTNGINFNDWWAFDANNLGVNNSTLNCSAYPNPSTDVLNIEFNYNEEVTVKILDYTGKVIYQGVIADPILQLNTSNYPRGVYQIVISKENDVLANKTIQFI